MMLPTDTIHALRRRAASVYDDVAMSRSRRAARALVPAIRALSNTRGQARMHQACAELAAIDPEQWNRHGDLGALAARVAISAGVEHVRGALAFWATERDPAVWQTLAA